jgi:predicted permease
MSLAPLLRRLGRSRRLGLSVVICIAIGTAGMSAALTLASAVLLRPLPYPEADRLVRIWRAEPEGEPRVSLSYPDLVDLRQALVEPDTGLDALEATARARMQFRSRDGVRRTEGEAVTAGYFDLLGVRPVVGRTFTPEEHQVGGPPVMLLDHRTWGERFGFDEAIVGRAIPTGQGEYTVVGVLPRDFTGTVEDDSGEIEFWVPIERYLSPEQQAYRSRGHVWTIGRLASGVGHSAIRSRVESAGAALVERYPDAYAAHRFRVEPMGENWRSAVRGGSILLLVAAGFVLLAAALNVAVLLIAYTLDQRRELAVRNALGADRGRIIRMVLTEIAILVVSGGILGFALGPSLLRTFVHRETLNETSMLESPVFAHLEIDPIAATLSFLALVLTALVAGLGPALLASRTDAARILVDGGRTTEGRGARRWTTALIVTEVALTTVLLVGTALLGRSYRAMADRDLGFRSDHVLRIGLFVNEDEVAESDGLEPFYQRVREELAKEQGVGAVGVLWPTMPLDSPVEQRLRVPGMDVPDPEHPDAGLPAGLFIADAAFFEVTGIPLLAGRGFESSDLPDSAPVALVSRALAERIASGKGSSDFRSVVESEVFLAEADDPVRIVGVVGNVSFSGPREADTPVARNEVYLPFSQSPQRLMSLTISTHQNPAELIPPLTRRLTELAPVSALDWIGPLDRWLADLFMRETKFLLSIVGTFSLVCLFLSMVGLAAVLANAVARRGHEIGVRRALGATAMQVQRVVIVQGLKMVASGAIVGAILSWLARKTIASFVFDVPPTDWVSYLVAVAILAGAAVGASIIPARRASRIDPATLLRSQ